MTDNVHQLRSPLALQLEEQMARLGLSQNKAADRMSLSSTALSQWRRGIYTGDNAAVESAVRKWLDTEEETGRHSLEAARLDRHMGLAITGEIGWLLTHAQATGDIVVVQGASGSGKSWAAENYCRTHSVAHYIEMTPTVRTLTVMLGLVGEAVGGFSDARSAHQAERAVIDRLKGRRALLVIDEAQYLTPTLLDELCSVRNKAGVGVALLGNKHLGMRLAQCPQIIGRTADRIDSEGPSEADVELLVSGFLERPAKRSEVRLGLAAARGDGGFHALRRMLARAWMMARIEERDAVTAADLELATRGAAAAA